MFRRIVSNLSFSPALVGQLGFYAKRLRKEEATRRLGLVFTALALVVQSLAVISPPEAANAASEANFIPGGISTKQQLMAHYDANTNRIAGLLTSIGITRAELANVESGTISSAGVEGKYNWSRTSLYSAADGQRSYTFNNGAGNVTFYYRPLKLTQANPPYDVFIGHSKLFGWFAIMKSCGNLVTSKPPQELNPQASCQGLNIEQLAPNRFRFTATAGTKDGADVKGYVYDVSSGGNVVDTKKVDSKQLTNSIVYDRTQPGTYHVRVTVQTTRGPKTNANCVDSFIVNQKPTAACVSVGIDLIHRSTVSLTGKAATANGATIKKYVFIVKNANGSVVKRIVVQSDKKSATADNFELSPGDYAVKLTVATSVGDLTGADCTAAFTVSPPKVCAYNPTLPPNSPDCQPCPLNSQLWIKDAKCDAELIFTKYVTNMTQGNIDGSSKNAKASDKLSYILTVQNKGLASEKVTMSENLTDVLEYANLVDQGGGSFDTATKTLTWPAFDLAAGAKQSREIAVQVMDQVPSTNTGTSDSESYDCKMINTFGNSTEVNVDCAPQKEVVEQITSELPHTGPRENLIFAGTLLAVVVYFYARSRQLGTEVRLIRRNLNTGTI